MENTKECKVCGEIKLLSEFNNDRRSKDGKNRKCKECKRKYDNDRYDKIKNDPDFKSKKLEHGRKYRENHKEKIKEYSLDYNNRPETIERKSKWYQEKVGKSSVKEMLRRMYYRAKKRALEGNYPFNIDQEDIIFIEKCPILGINLDWTYCNGRTNNTPSLDKINPKLGYVKGNVQVISWLANLMKSNANKEELEMFCKNIPKYLNNEDIVRTTEKNESVELKDKEPLG